MFTRELNTAFCVEKWYGALGTGMVILMECNYNLVAWKKRSNPVQEERNLTFVEIPPQKRMFSALCGALSCEGAGTGPRFLWRRLRLFSLLDQRDWFSVAWCYGGSTESGVFLICTRMLLMHCTNPVLTGKMWRTDEWCFYYYYIILFFVFLIRVGFMASGEWSFAIL